VNIIPHTQVETIIGEYEEGRKVNLEVDLVARYLERLNQGEGLDANAIDKDFLARHGFS
jgi:riboflavin synthase